MTFNFLKDHGLTENKGKYFFLLIQNFAWLLEVELITKLIYLHLQNFTTSKILNL